MAEVQDDKERMLKAYRRIIKTVMLVTAVCMFALGAVSEPLIYSLIGRKWHQAASFLPFICISMSLYPLHSINLNMLQVQGRSDLFLYLEIIKKIVSVGPICLGIFVNIYWMLVGSIVAGIISFFLNTYYTGKKLHYSSWMQLKDIAPSYGIALTVALSVYFLKYLPFSCYLVLAIQIVVGLVVTFVICETLRPEEYVELKNISKKFIKKIVRKQ
jgi:O-antigen/teichoic acid export membrane protein